MLPSVRGPTTEEPYVTENPLTAAARRGAVLAGPAAVLSLLLFVAALAVFGDQVGAVSRSAVGVTSSALALVSVALLMLGLVHLAVNAPALQDRHGRNAVLAAAGGTLLLAGGAWSQLVILPAITTEAPRMAEQGHPLVTAAYVVTFLAAGAGWLLVALRLRRDPQTARLHARLLIAGAVVMVPPLPTRWFLLAVAVTLLARRGTAVAVAVAPQPIPATG